MYLYPELKKNKNENFFSKLVFNIKNYNLSDFGQQLDFPNYYPELIYRSFINSFNELPNRKKNQFNENIFDNYYNSGKYAFKRNKNPYDGTVSYKITTTTDNQNLKLVKENFYKIAILAENEVKLILKENYSFFLKNFEKALKDKINKDKFLIKSLENENEINSSLQFFIIENKYKIAKNEALLNDNFIKDFLDKIELDNSKIIFFDYDNATFSLNYLRYLNIILAIFFSFFFTLTIGAIRVEIINTSK